MGLSLCLMSERKAKVVQLGESYAIFLPKDWCRGEKVRKGTVLRIEYNGIVKVYGPEEKE